jgi:hypothetical protein
MHDFSVYANFRQCISSSNDPLERAALEHTLQSMKQRIETHAAALDDFQVTPFDVIIYEHKSLGRGGYGRVYEGNWLGTVVAVKVFERGIPQSVRVVFAFAYLSRHELYYRFLSKRLTFGSAFVIHIFYRSSVLA